MKIDDGFYASIGRQLKERREELGWSLVELEKRLNHYKGKSTLMRYEHGQHEMNHETLVRLCDCLGLDPDAVLQKAREENNVSSISPNLRVIMADRLQVLGGSACGEPIYNENFSGTYFNADYALEAQGDSMEPTIQDRDVVLVEKCEMVENGEIAIITYNDELSVKRFYYYADSDIVILRSENRKHGDIMINGESLQNLKVIGKAVGTIHRLK